jgi:ubiquinone biosynthesis monooxygenase Coq7
MVLSSPIHSTSILGNRILKVDHAGEQGAICLYRAQRTIARLTAPAMVEHLSDFLIHEKRHRAVFGGALMRRRAARSPIYWPCALGGYLLGFVTGLLGARSIAATTIAVESTVLRHLERQRREVAARDPAAVGLIASIIEDERIHHDRFLDRMNVEAWWLRALQFLVSASTEAVIRVGMKVG